MLATAQTAHKVRDVRVIFSIQTVYFVRSVTIVCCSLYCSFRISVRLIYVAREYEAVQLDAPHSLLAEHDHARICIRPIHLSVTGIWATARQFVLNLVLVNGCTCVVRIPGLNC